MNLNKIEYITGVGSRKTPSNICDVMTFLMKSLKGATLRSGGADGADRAFEDGAVSKEIYLPWKGFNGNASELWLGNFESAQLYAMADRLIKEIHPLYHSLKPSVKKLHIRNVFQVLGKNLDLPSDILVCYTPDGAYKHSMCTGKTGGTATAIKIAEIFGVPVYNLGNDKHFNELLNLTDRLLR